MAFARLESRYSSEPQPVAEPVEERSDAARLIAGGVAGKADLFGRQGLDRKGGEDHVLNTEAGIDCVEPLLEEGREVAWIAARESGAEPDPFDPPVDAVEGEIEPPRSHPLPRQTLDEIRGQPLRRERQIGRLGDRLSEAQPHASSGCFAQWRQRFGQIVQRLVEPPRHCLAKTASQRIARHRIEIADPLQADPPQTLGGCGVEAEGLHRQRSEGGATISRRQDDGVLAHFGKAGRRPGGAERVGNGDAGCDTPAVPR